MSPGRVWAWTALLALACPLHALQLPPAKPAQIGKPDGTPAASVSPSAPPPTADVDTATRERVAELRLRSELTELQAERLSLEARTIQLEKQLRELRGAAETQTAVVVRGGRRLCGVRGPALYHYLICDGP